MDITNGEIEHAIVSEGTSFYPTSLSPSGRRIACTEEIPSFNGVMHAAHVYDRVTGESVNLGILPSDRDDLRQSLDKVESYLLSPDLRDSDTLIYLTAIRDRLTQTHAN